jgi:hypothetical protein
LSILWMRFMCNVLYRLVYLVWNQKGLLFRRYAWIFFVVVVSHWINQSKWFFLCTIVFD